MNNDGGKKTGMVRFLIAGLLLTSAALGVWAFCSGKLERTEGSVDVFDGWIYGREDQKKASAALASAGFDNYSWHDGKLSVPVNKRSEYQAALASAGAYPKAPSELRVEAVREMSVFESDAKTRIRELNACVMQLERTIEQMRGVEYATVGVRSRKEQVGLTTKNIVTASVGVAFLEGRSLDADALSAITVAAKHQLGIDDVANISIIDLKEGKSYFGFENAVGVSSDVALVAEKERIEKYWRNKYLEAFSDIRNIRVSVVADVVHVSSDMVEQEASDASDSSVYPASYVEAIPVTEEVAPFEPRRLATAPVKGRFETLGNLAEDKASSKEAEHRSEPYAEKSDISKKNGAYGFAQLGNPGKNKVRTVRKRREPVLTTVGKPNENNDVAVKTSSRFHWTDSGACSYMTTFASADGDNRFQKASKTVPFFEKNLKAGVADSIFFSGVCYQDDEARTGGLVCKPMAMIRQVGSVEPDVEGESSAAVERHDESTQLRSIAVRIAVPRSYLRGVVARNSGASAPQETFAVDPEERALEEIKRYAVDLFRPTGEQLGWSEDELNRWFVVAAFSDSEFISGELPTEAGETIVEGQKSGLEHSSLYVQEHDDWSPVVPPSGVRELNSDVSSIDRENTRDNLIVVAEPNGKVAEVAQTVASDVETLSEEVEQDVEKLENSLERCWTLFSAYVPQVRDPLFRNVGVGVVAAVLFVGFLPFVRRIRRGRNVNRNATAKRKKSSVTEVAGRVSQKLREASGDLGNVSTADDKRRFQSETSADVSRYYDELDDLEEYNDELEGELQKIAAAHDASFPRQSSDVDSDSETSSTKRTPDVPSDEYWTKRLEALNLIAQYPERAAASLQRWARKKA